MSRLYRRIRQPVDGGEIVVRLYRDGSCRITVDHPSNDRAVELAILHQANRIVHQALKAAGVGNVRITRLEWRSDPPEVPA